MKARISFLHVLFAAAACHLAATSQAAPVITATKDDGLAAGYAADDGAALHFVGTELVGAVSSRPRAKAYRVARRDGAVVEEEIPTRFLGA